MITWLRSNVNCVRGWTTSSQIRHMFSICAIFWIFGLHVKIHIRIPYSRVTISAPLSPRSYKSSIRAELLSKFSCPRVTCPRAIHNIHKMRLLTSMQLFSWRPSSSDFADPDLSLGVLNIPNTHLTTTGYLTSCFQVRMMRLLRMRCVRGPRVGPGQQLAHVHATSLGG